MKKHSLFFVLAILMLAILFGTACSKNQPIKEGNYYDLTEDNIENLYYIMDSIYDLLEIEYEDDIPLGVTLSVSYDDKWNNEELIEFKNYKPDNKIKINGNAKISRKLSKNNTILTDSTLINLKVSGSWIKTLIVEEKEISEGSLSYGLYWRIDNYVSEKYAVIINNRSYDYNEILDDYNYQ